MKIKANCPGQPYNGREYEATRETLTFGSAMPRVDKHYLNDWGARAKTLGWFEVDCYIVTDPEFGEFAIPVALATELSAAA